MTEGLGRRARWTAALLITPGAAALFGASTSWVVSAHPSALTTSTPVSPPITLTAPAPSGDLLLLRSSLAANKAQLAGLQHAVQKLQNQIRLLSSQPASGTITRATGNGSAAIARAAAPITSGSAVTAPVVSAPVVNAPVVNAPVAAAPAPVHAPPVARAPVAAAPAPVQAPPAAAAPAPPPVHAVTGASGAPK